MPRYAMIDIDSRFVYGVRDANDPVAACKALDESLSEHGRTYEMHGAHSLADQRSQPGYIVHQGAPELHEKDGQDPDYIAAIEKLPRVAVVLVTAAAAAADPAAAA